LDDSLCVWPLELTGTRPGLYTGTVSSTERKRGDASVM
jgi:hypothetical protein